MRFIFITGSLLFFFLILTYSAIGASPDGVGSLTVSKESNDTILTWPEITTDIYSGSVTTDHYNIYRSTSPHFAPDLSGHSNLLDQTSTTSYTDNNALLSDQSYFYYVTAVDTNGYESLVPSNLGCKLHLNLTYNATKSNTYWLAPPQYTEYQNASDLGSESSNISQVIAWNATSQSQMVWNSDGSGTDFPIEPHKANGVTVTNSTKLNLVGSYSFDAYQWDYNQNKRNAHWISLPQPHVHQNASSLAANIPNATKIARFDTTNSTFQSWFNLDGQWMGENFPLKTDEGYLAALQDASTWTPVPTAPHEVTALVNATECHVPCNLTLNGTAQDHDGQIVSFEWDVDSDGAFDHQSTTSPLTTAAYDQAGTFHPTLLVTDDDGFTGYDYETVQVYSLNQDYSADSFLPGQGETLQLNANVSANGYLSISIYDEAGNLVKTLVVDEAVTEGLNTFQWDGTNNYGETVEDGSYYAVFDFNVDGSTYDFTQDLRASTGGTDITSSITDIQVSDSFSPVEGEYVGITYTLPQKARVSINIQDDQGQVLRNLLDNALRATGTHNETWEGYDENGTVVEAGTAFFVDITAQSLAENGIIVKGLSPAITEVNATNTRFSPSTNPYGSQDKSQVTITFQLNKAANVNATILDENSQLVRNIDLADLVAGQNSLIWNGRNNSGILCTDGFYTLRFLAQDSDGRASQTFNAQIEIFY